MKCEVCGEPRTRVPHPHISWCQECGTLVTFEPQPATYIPRAARDPANWNPKLDRALADTRPVSVHEVARRSN